MFRADPPPNADDPNASVQPDIAIANTININDPGVYGAKAKFGASPTGGIDVPTGCAFRFQYSGSNGGLLTIESSGNFNIADYKDQPIAIMWLAATTSNPVNPALYGFLKGTVRYYAGLHCYGIAFNYDDGTGANQNPTYSEGDNGYLSWP